MRSGAVFSSSWHMHRSMRSLFRLFSLLLAFFLLSGCGASGSRSDYFASMGQTEPPIATTGGDIPVGAEPIVPCKRVALTLDDGPHNVRTVQIVDELNKYGYHATFFVVGNRVDGTEYAGGNALRYAVASGNEIGIHGYTHTAYYDSCSDKVYNEELNKTAQAIRQLIPGYQIRLMRPVGGRITGARVMESEYAIILWDVDSEDWKNKYYAGISDAEAEARVNTIVENVMSTVQDGSIILMHDLYESTYDALGIILARLHAEGYEVVTVSELLGDGLQSGQQYRSK